MSSFLEILKVPEIELLSAIKVVKTLTDDSEITEHLTNGWFVVSVWVDSRHINGTYFESTCYVKIAWSSQGEPWHPPIADATAT